VEDLERLPQRLKGLTLRRPGFAVCLWGEPGIGKTHTVTELMRQSPTRSLSLHATITLQNLVRSLPTPSRLPTWTQPILEKLHRNNEHLRNEHTASAVGAVLNEIAPFVLHLEDIHEIDSERLEWLTALGNVVTRLKGVALIVTSRHAPPQVFEAMRLEPLEAQETQRLLEVKVGAVLPREAIQWIQARAAGNPLYTLEFLRLLSQQGHLWNDARQWHWRAPERSSVPVTIEAIVERQLLEAMELHGLTTVLQTRAMLPWGTPRSLWAAVADVSIQELEAGIVTLERRGLLVRGEFAHPLYREIARDFLPDVTRQALAGRVVHALETEQPEEAAAFVDEAKLEPSHALEVLRNGAARLMERGDVLQAGVYLTRTVDLVAPEHQPALALEVARRVRHVNVPEAMRLALRAQTDIDCRAEATQFIAELLAVQGRSQEAERALETLPDLGTPVWWRRLVQVRGVASNDAGILEIVAYHSEALVDADVATISRVARTLANNGQIERARSMIDDALQTLDLELESRVLLLKASSLIAYASADYQRMDALEQDILVFARQLGNLRWVDAAHFNRALAQEALGDHLGRMRSLELAMRTCEELGDPTALAIAQVAYGAALHASAHYEAAENILLVAHGLLSTLDVSVYLMDCHVALVRLYLDWNPPHGLLLSEKYARAGLGHAQTLRVEHNLIVLESLGARVNVRTQRVLHALERTTRAVEAARRLELPAVLATALEAHGYALEGNENVNDAIAAWQESEAISRDTFDLNSAHLVGLEADRLEGNTASARERERWFEARGLWNGVNLCRRYFAPQVKTPTTPESSSLNVLGVMHFFADESEIAVRGAKRRALLVVLLEARVTGRSEVNRLELLDALYPDEDEDRAASSLKELIRSTRANLGANLIQTIPHGYALGGVVSDVETFLETGDSSLWRGVYLQGSEIAGSDAVRETLSLALQHRVEELLEGNPREAARLSRLLLEMNPYDLEPLRLCVQAFKAGENYKTLGRVYNEARVRWLDVGEVLPERWQVFLEAVPSVSVPA
jgi:tetratricopeptide (TPR) repeat protein